MTHNYTCKDCGYKWVGFYKKSETPKCIKCGSFKWNRLGSPQVQFNPITDKHLRKELGEDIL